MQVRWKTLFTKVIIWLGSELFLNLVGLDNLADYSEYIFTPPHLITPVITIQA